MRLIRLEVEGYKRFGVRNRMNVDGRVIAIVGPNEAGKTSFLEALTHLNRGGGLDQSEWTRDGARPRSSVVLARFAIDDEDRSAMGKLPGAEQARWYVLYKAPKGRIFHHIEPSGFPHRDLDPRHRVQQPLRRASGHRLMRNPDEPERPSALANQLSQLTDELAAASESLEEDVFERIREAAAALRQAELDDRSPKYLRALPDDLEALADHEAADHPRDIALNILDQRHSRFLVFGDEERDLRSDYDLVEVAEAPPAALRNLIDLAELDLRALRDSAGAGDYPRVETMLEEANNRLRAVFERVWQQSGVYMRLRTDETVLRIFVSATGGGYTTVAERSDGLRAFIALLTFTALYAEGRPPVLLVDEAENHLHYDAQADLVRVFSTQQAAAKIIYTTHSAGCLPQDLAGVRLIAANSNGRSTIRNAFWSEAPGLTPLLIGMGASVLAFSAARRAVFVDGGSDVVLVPSLLREACNLNDLGFQVAPGLSEIRLDQIEGLDVEAAAVAYMVDGDEGGAKIRRKLVRGGVPDDRVVVLGGEGSGVVLEDTLRKHVYVRAVNADLALSHGEGVNVGEADIGNCNRPQEVQRWCQRRGVTVPNKTAVAYRALDLRAEGHSLVEPAQAKALQTLYERLAVALKLGVATGAAG